MKDIDDRFRPAFEASSTSTDGPDLQAIREILYLEGLYGAAINYRAHGTQTEFGTVLSVIFSFGPLFLAGISISLVLHWAMETGMKAFGT